MFYVRFVFVHTSLLPRHAYIKKKKKILNIIINQVSTKTTPHNRRRGISYIKGEVKSRNIAIVKGRGKIGVERVQLWNGKKEGAL